MAEPLDNIIFVGFPIPDERTDNGKSTYRHIMDSANVPRDKIFFYPENTPLPEIIRKTFTQDKSEEFGYRIGNTLCIGSDNVGVTYRHKLELLNRKIRIPVKTGYEHVDLSTLTEAEMSHWLENGNYKEISTNEENEDILDDLLSGDLTSSNEDNRDTSAPVEEDNSVFEEPTSDDLTYRSAFQQDAENEIDFDELMDSVEEKNSVTEDSPSSGNQATENTDSVQENVDEVNDFNVDDLFDEVAQEPASSPAPAPAPVSASEPEPEPEPVSETVSETVTETVTPTNKDNDLLDDLFDEVDTPVSPEHDRQGSSPVSALGTPVDDVTPMTSPSVNNSEKSQTVNSVDGLPIDDRDIADDDMEYIKRAERNRERARLQDEENRRRREELERMATEEQGYGAFGDDEFFRDELGESSNQMRQRVEHVSESSYTNDGRKKNYRDYLTEEEARSQLIAERTREKFGEFDMDYDQDAKTGDLKYVGEGTGRIILCTSGKGGVGKSLVANGLAMALSLARAKEAKTNPGANNARTWLIESDYNSPHLAMAFKTGKKNIGNIARAISGRGKAVDRSLIRKAIEENVYVDKATGIHVLACPPQSSGKSSKEIPFAILLAVKYASDRGDDVIIDHGNLTSGEYSELDQVLSLQLAHRVVIVSNMGCIPETQSVLQLLCDRERNSVVPARPVPSVSLVLNSARKEQFTIAQDMLKPFEIINILPPIDAFRAENSLHGSTYLPDAPKEIQKAVMDRCGIMLTKLGYESMRKYFSIKSTFNTSKKTEGGNIFKRLSDFVSGSN